MPGGCAGLGHVASGCPECWASGRCSWVEAGMLCGLAPWGFGVPVTLGVSGRWRLPPLSPDWPCALEATSPAAPGPPSARQSRPPCRPRCPTVIGLPREPSAGPSQPGLFRLRAAGGHMVSIREAPPTSPPRWRMPGSRGSWNEALPLPLPGPHPPGSRGFFVRALWAGAWSH